MTFCEICGHKAASEDNYCCKCGRKLVCVNCPRCKGIINEDWAFCRQCGYKLDQTVKQTTHSLMTSEKEQKSKINKRAEEARRSGLLGTERAGQY